MTWTAQLSVELVNPWIYWIMRVGFISEVEQTVTTVIDVGYAAYFVFGIHKPFT
jgi:hypothetical protein